MLKQLTSQILSSYGMTLVLLLLCVYYSWATLQPQQTTGAEAAPPVARRIMSAARKPDRVLVVTSEGSDDIQFGDRLGELLRQQGVPLVEVVHGDPVIVRHALRALASEGQAPGVIAGSQQCAAWLPNLVKSGGPLLAQITPIFPEFSRWPTFLTRANLFNIVGQIVVFAIIGVGMTMVIVTGGIDLSVGSLVAFSSVVVGVLVRDLAHGDSATPTALLFCSIAAVLASAAVGCFSGAMVTVFGVPSFIATLAMMKVASGLAYILSSGESIYDIPLSYTWLDRGTTLGPVPNAVALMVLVYVVAYVFMSRTRFGRYIYAIGGNKEASRLSGVPVPWVQLLVYTLSGAMAGLGGVVITSQLKSASPTYGVSYELVVIASVVVGGASLAGGSGTIVGTLIGALIMAVIQNGMNQTGVQPFRQEVVLGLVILGAVLIDSLKHRSWRLPQFRLAAAPPPVAVADMTSTPQSD